MMRKPNLLMILTVAVSIAVFSTSIVAQAPCKCSDKAYLLMLLKEAEAAIAEYQNQLTAFGDKEYTSDDYEKILKPAIDKAIDKVRTEPHYEPSLPEYGGIIYVDGELDRASCQMSINRVSTIEKHRPLSNAPPCLRKILEARLKRSQEACQAIKSGESDNLFFDYRKERKMSVVIQELISGYEDEKRFIAEQIKNFSCDEWSGVVNYESIQKISKTDVVPPKPSEGRLGGQTVTELGISHKVTILVINGEAYAGQNYTLKSTKDSEYKRNIPCGTNKFFTHTFTGNETTIGNVQGFDKALSFGVFQNSSDQYSISFRAPVVKGGIIKNTSVYSPYPPQCGQPNKPTPPTSGPLNLNSELGYTARGKGHLTNNFLNDSETVPMPGGVWTIRVSWTLRRKEH